MALKVGELFASFGIDSSGVESSLKGIEAQCKDIGSSVTGLGAGMSVALTAPITKAFKDIYSAGVGFNAQMSRVFAIRGLDLEADVDKIEALNAEALRMAAATKFTTEEAGQAYEYMAMAGWDVKDMLAGLEPIMNLAIASGNDLGTVSDIVTDAMTAFGLAADGVSRVLGENGEWINVNNVEHFSDVLAAVSTNANTNVSIMGETFKYVAAQAGAMGYSIDDMAIGIGLMANAGIKGSQAGTALKNLLTNMAKPTDTVAAAMKKLGIRLDDGKGNMLSFRDIMKNLRKGFGGLKISTQELTKETNELDAKLAAGKITQAEYDTAVKDLMERAYGAEGALKAETAAALAGKYGMAGLLSIIGATEEDFNDLCEAVDHATGTTKKMGETMMANAKGDITKLSSAINVLETDLWSLVEGPFRDTIKSITDMVNKFTALDDATKSDALRFAALAAATGPVLVAAGKIIQKAPAITKAIMSLATPLGITTLGLALFAVAAVDQNNTVGKAFESMSKKAAEKLNKLSEDIETQTPIISKRMGDLITSLNNGVNDLLPALGTAGTSALSSFMTAITDNAEGIVGLGNSIITNIVSGISESLPTLIPKGITMVATIAVSLIKSAPLLVASATKLMGKFVEGIMNTDWVALGKDIFTALSEAISGTGKEIESSLDDASKRITSTDWAGLGTQMIDMILTGTSDISSQVTTFITNIVTKLGEFNGWSSLASQFSVVAQKLIGGIAGEIPKLAGDVATIITKIGEVMEKETGSDGFVDAFRLLSTQILYGIKNALPDVEKGAETIISAIADTLNKIKWEEAVTTASKIGEAIVSVIVQGIHSTTDLAVKLTGTVASMFQENGMATKLMASAKIIVGTLISSIEQVITKFSADAGRIIDTLVDSLFTVDKSTGKSTFTTAIDSLTGLLESIVNGLVDAIPKIGTAGTNLLNKLFESLFKTDEEGNSVLTQTLTGLNGLVSAIISGIGDLFKKENADNLIGSLKTVLQTAIAGLVDVVPDLATDIISLADEIVKVLFHVDEGEDGSVVTTALTSLETLAVSLLNGIGDLFSKDNIENVTTAMNGLVEDILTGIANGIKTAGSVAANILTALGTALFGSGEGDGFVSFGTQALTGLVETIFTELSTNVIPGLGVFAKKVFGAFVDLLSGENIGNLTSGLSTLGTAIITGLANTLSSVASTLFSKDGGVVTDLANGVKGIAESLATAIAGGFKELSSGGVSGSLAAAAVNLVNGMTDALPTLFKTGESVMSAGFKIATSIMGSIVQSLQDINASGLANSIGIAAKELLKNLLGFITNFGENDDVKNFMKNLGEGFRSTMSLLGNIVGDILGYIFSPEGINDIWNAGKAIAGLLWDGIEAVISGVGEFVLGIFHIDSDTLSKESEQLQTDIAYMIQSAFGGDIGEHAFVTEGASDLAKYFNDKFLDQLDWGGQSADQMKGSIRDYFVKAVNGAIDEGLIDADWGLRAQALADNDEFWQTISEAFVESKKTGKKFNLFDFLFDQAQSDESANKAKQVLDQYGVQLSESAQETADTVSATVADAQEMVDNLGNDFAKKGFATGVAQGEQPAKDAALQVSDAVVKQFLLTMSEENGKKLGSAFVGAIKNGLLDEAATTALNNAVTDVSNSVIDNFNALMSADVGYVIGYNFDDGIAQGIYDGIILIQDAAIAAGSAAADAAGEYLKVGSPSKLARDEIGLMFSAGIAQGMTQGISYVTDAATDVARSMHDSFYVEDSSRGTVDTSRQYANRTAQATAQAQEENRDERYEAIGRAIADRLIESGVLESDIIIDGEIAGRKLARPVSSTISKKSNETIAGRSLQGVLTT